MGQISGTFGDGVPIPQPGTLGIAVVGDRIEVWLQGEHDPATVDLIGTALDEVAAMGVRDVVVDLSQTDFMDASTLRALIHGRALLAAHGRHLSLRSPQPHASRLLAICDLADMIEPDEPKSTAGHPATALETWIEVPHDDRSEETAPEPSSDAFRHHENPIVDRPPVAPPPRLHSDSRGWRSF